MSKEFERKRIGLIPKVLAATSLAVAGIAFEASKNQDIINAEEYVQNQQQLVDRGGGDYLGRGEGGFPKKTIAALVGGTILILAGGTITKKISGGNGHNPKNGDEKDN